ncbi:hypothetical protein BLSTO_00773 [Blastocystis sp. subtype 1]
MSDTGADFASVVDMTESNFLTYLPQVLECIKNCDFIAFDLEFSGTDYKPYFRSVYADTFETRYAKYRVEYALYVDLTRVVWEFAASLGMRVRSGEDFAISFISSYMSRPFNFFVCPYSHKLCNPSLSIRASTLSFLRQHNFKFGRLFSEGIPTLRKSDEEHILRYQRLSADRYDYKSDEELEEMEGIYAQIEEWIRSINSSTKAESTEEDRITTLSLLLPPLNSHKRKLLYQEMARRYPSMILSEQTQDNEDFHTGKIKRTRITVAKKASEVLAPTLPEITNHAGVRIVVEAVLDSHKPLIGFQGLGDLTYMLGGIYQELPPRLADFLRFMERVDVFVDLKLVAELPALREENLGSLSLSNAYQAVRAVCGSDGQVHDWYFGEPDVKSALIQDGSICIHDAANDAFMTGILFLKLFYRCGFKREAIGSLLQTKPEGAMRESMQAFLSCVNAVSLYHMTHALPLRLEAYNDLVNGDATVRDRKNVLIIEDIAPWFNSKHFSTFFSKHYGVKANIYFNWLDDSRMLAVLPSQEVAEKVLQDWQEVCMSEDSEASFSSGGRARR